jgi:hypothetical protein
MRTVTRGWIVALLLITSACSSNPEAVDGGGVGMDTGTSPSEGGVVVDTGLVAPDAAGGAAPDGANIASGADGSILLSDAGAGGDVGAPISAKDWPDLQSVLAGIQGTAMTPINGVVTTLYTPGMLMGNGDLGVVAGGTNTSQTVYFAKNDFWGSSWAANHQVLINSYLSMGSLTISSPTPSPNPAPVYKMVQDILNAEVRTTMQLGNVTVNVRSWTADSDNVFVTELSTNPGAGAVTLQIDLAMPPTNIAVAHTTYPFTVGTSNGVLWATRSNNATVIDTPGNIGGSADPTDYESRVGIAVVVVGSGFTAATPAAADVSGTLTLNGGATVQLVTVFQNDTRIGPSGPTADALKTMAVSKASAMTAADVTAMQADHMGWWKNFWLKSYVRLNDPVLETFYYGALYAVASASRAGHVPPGIFGNYITNDTPGWGGRYVLNYNFEAPFYGVFSSNRPELALPYTEEIFAVRPWQQNHTASAGYQGVEYQRALSPFAMAAPAPAPIPVAPTKTPNDPMHGLPDQKSNAGFASLPTIWYYEYTLDGAYLQNKLYPHLKAIDAFWRDYMTFDGTRYVVQQSATHEQVVPIDTNPNSDLGFIRKNEKTLIAASNVLGVDAALRPVWQDVLAKLSAYPTGLVNGKTVFLNCESSVGTTNPVSLFEFGGQPVNMEGPVFPGEDVAVGGDPKMLQTAIDSVMLMNSWGVTAGGNTHNGFPKEFPIAARVGWPADDLVTKFKAAILYQWRASNLTVAEAGGGIETSGAIETINSMLMQSEGGVVRVFPVWPLGKDAYFRRLRAKGAFVVSSDFKAGQVTGVTVTSEKGGPFNLVDPWKTSTPKVQQVDGDGNVLAQVASTLSNGILTLATSPGLTYQIGP